MLRVTRASINYGDPGGESHEACGAWDGHDVYRAFDGRSLGVWASMSGLGWAVRTYEGATLD